ncbi:unnamed protein product [Kuraishia capsulata CBS 1993]|uniref:Kinetochore protein mis13 n=1 Tax=Kuraishia capsulata CBS 1993 TaxID=1382522 RepID=W6MMH8_9ASCO|nr:uncharacterized protein KUCA_T00003735001 [Kuraishia capsulata CBS 1993]CDK27756.1 unnamed protein product [Kuraishia capsulata CBS 1993]
MPPRKKKVTNPPKKQTEPPMPSQSHRLGRGSKFGKLFLGPNEKAAGSGPVSTPKGKKTTAVFPVDSPEPSKTTPKTKKARNFGDEPGSLSKTKRSALQLQPDLPPPVKKTKQSKSKPKASVPKYVEEADVSVIPIEFSPLKKKTPEKGRRSSLGKRGKRVSSIGNGFVAVPHDDVLVEDFYKHFDESSPEPHKMRQLLTWNAKRVMRQHSTQHFDPQMFDAWQIATQIKEMIIRDFEEGNIETSWLNRSDEGYLKKVMDTTRPIRLSPNEVNVTNRRNMDILESKMRLLRAEEKQWQESMTQITASLGASPEVADVKALVQRDEIKELEQRLPFNVAELVDESALKEHAIVVQEVDSKTSELVSSSIAKFKALTHRLNSVNTSADCFAETETKKMESILKEHFGKKVPVENLLKGISRVPT